MIWIIIESVMYTISFVDASWYCQISIAPPYDAKDGCITEICYHSGVQNLSF